MKLCSNCLQDGGAGVPVGHEKGGQRDAYRESVFLCPTCSSALVSGDFSTLHDRYAAERTITNRGNR